MSRQKLLVITVVWLAIIMLAVYLPEEAKGNNREPIIKEVDVTSVVESSQKIRLKVVTAAIEGNKAKYKWLIQQSKAVNNDKEEKITYQTSVQPGKYKIGIQISDQLGNTTGHYKEITVNQRTKLEINCFYRYRENDVKQKKKKIKQQAVTTQEKHKLVINSYQQDKTLTSFDKLVAVSSEQENQHIIEEVPYFCQYDNQYWPEASCQNTSMAMVLKYYGWWGKPDNITEDYGKRRTQYSAQFTEIFNHYARNNNLEARIKAKFNRTAAQINKILRSGRPVIAHGYFTVCGHVVVLVGYDEEYYYVNDPAGKWTGNYKGGYYAHYGGDYIRYPREKVLTALGGSGNIWIHKPVKVVSNLVPQDDQSISIFED